MSNPVLLATVEDFIEAIGQDAALLADVTQSLTGAIVRATARLEGLLRTNLYRGAIQDLFHCDPGLYRPLGGRYRFQLTNGCVRSDVEPEVSVSDSEDGPFTPISGIWDHNKGFVACKTAEVETKYVRCSYESGYNVPSEVPHQLHHAILMLAPLMVLSSVSTALDPKQQAAATEKAKSLESMAQDLIVPFMRNVGALVKVLSSVRIDIEPPAPAPAPAPAPDPEP